MSLLHKPARSRTVRSLLRDTSVDSNEDIQQRIKSVIKMAVQSKLEKKRKPYLTRRQIDISVEVVDSPLKPRYKAALNLEESTVTSTRDLQDVTPSAFEEPCEPVTLQDLSDSDERKDKFENAKQHLVPYRKLP